MTAAIPLALRRAPALNRVSHQPTRRPMRTAGCGSRVHSASGSPKTASRASAIIRKTAWSLTPGRPTGGASHPLPRQAEAHPCAGIGEDPDPDLRGGQAGSGTPRHPPRCRSGKALSRHKRRPARRHHRVEPRRIARQPAPRRLGPCTVFQCARPDFQRGTRHGPWAERSRPFGRTGQTWRSWPRGAGRPAPRTCRSFSAQRRPDRLRTRHARRRDRCRRKLSSMMVTGGGADFALGHAAAVGIVGMHAHLCVGPRLPARRATPPRRSSRHVRCRWEPGMRTRCPSISAGRRANQRAGAGARGGWRHPQARSRSCAPQ